MQFHSSPATVCETSPISTSSEATIKPLRIEPPTYTDATYYNSPPTPYHDSSPISPNPSSHPPRQCPPAFQLFTHVDYLSSTASSERLSCSDDDDDDDVPLAQLLLYPRDAPPAYSTVVWQSYRETLLQHIPRHPVVAEMDEEAGFEIIRADDVSFKVERIVAMAVVMALLVLAGLMLGLLFVRN